MSEKEFFSKLKKLNTPKKIQDFLNKLDKNNEDSVLSPKICLEKNKAHCLEGALIAHAAFLLNNKKSFLLDIKSRKNDLDHVIVLFKEDGFWGAISKTSYPVLRFRDSVFRNIRELVMSYFSEYFLENGKKTMISYSKPMTLKKRKNNWMTTQNDLYELGWELDVLNHYPIASKNKLSKLRKADREEVERVFGI